MFVKVSNILPHDDFFLVVNIRHRLSLLLTALKLLITNLLIDWCQNRDLSSDWSSRRSRASGQTKLPRKIFYAFFIQDWNTYNEKKEWPTYDSKFSFKRCIKFMPAAKGKQSPCICKMHWHTPEHSSMFDHNNICISILNRIVLANSVLFVLNMWNALFTFQQKR